MLRLAVYLFALVSWSAEAEPLSEFKGRLDRIRTVVLPPAQVTTSKAPPKRGKKQSEWLRTEPTLDNIRYDVRRTDSLVSPFLAWVELEVSKRMDTYPSEQQARAASGPVKGHGLKYFFRLDFAYQDKKWVLARGWCSLSLLVSTDRTLHGSEKHYPIDPASGGCFGDKEVGIFVKPLLS